MFDDIVMSANQFVIGASAEGDGEADFMDEVDISLMECEDE